MNKEIWHKKILNFLAAKTATSFDVAEFHDVRINVISGRFTDLKDWGYIEEIGRRENKDGNLCAIYKITQKGYQFFKQLTQKART